MFSQFDLENYTEFRQMLASAKETLFQNTGDRASLKPSIMKLQQIFQNQILTLNLDTFDPILAHQVQSLHVEMDKQLKLLSMDAMFLQAAKQSATVEQRLQQASDRFTLLIQYCDVILQKPDHD